MPKAKPETPVIATGNDEKSLTVGLLDVLPSILAALPPTDFNRSWVVIADDRTKVRIPTTVDGHTRLAEYVIALSIMREPVTQDEAVKVATIDETRKAAQDARKKEEANRLQNEKEAAFKWGQQATLGALREVDALTKAAQTLAKMANVGAQG